MKTISRHSQNSIFRICDSWPDVHILFSGFGPGGLRLGNFRREGPVSGASHRAESGPETIPRNSNYCGFYGACDRKCQFC